MFFYLSQFFSFLIMPFTITLFVVLCGLILIKKTIGRRLLVTGFFLLLFFSNSFLANYVMHWWEPEFKDIASLPQYEVGIVLTGVTNLNKTVYDRTFFNKGADRATHAMQLYKLGKIKKILITGGQGLNPANANTEAELLADFMKIAGVDTNDIIIENKAVNTHENAFLTKEMLKSEGFDLTREFLIITSAFHMKRSEGCFARAGLKVVTFPVDYYANDPRLTIKKIIQPDPMAIILWHKLSKEWMGILIYKMVGYM